MLGSHAQQGLLQADNLYLDFVGWNTFCDLMASLRGDLFRDEDFADLYCPDNGRPGVPPSILATAPCCCRPTTAVPTTRPSSAPTSTSAGRWPWGPRSTNVGSPSPPCSCYRSQLTVHGKDRPVFVRSLEYARQSGYLKGRRMKLAIDTIAILGKGAVRDADNLIGDGCRMLIRALANLDGDGPGGWAAGNGYSLYFGKSLKGQAAIDWSDRKRRRKLLARIVADADSLLARARAVNATLEPGNRRSRDLVESARTTSITFAGASIIFAGAWQK